jgi:hypothetical protein
MIVQKPEAEKKLGEKLPGRKVDWWLLSSLGTRKLGGPYGKRTEAVARERQVQFFKHQARNPKKNPGNPMHKVAEMHPEDRAIVGSAVGSVAGYLVAPPLAPLGAAAGHIAGKRLGRQPKQNPLFGRKKKEPSEPKGKKKAPKKKPPKRKRHRSLRNIALDIKRSWREPWRAGPENRGLLRLRDTVDTMQTLCHPSDIVEEGPSRGKSGSAVIGNFLANSGGLWKGSDAKRIKDELRAIGAEEYWHDEAIENPRPFASRTHDWKEVLIQKDGKRVTRKQIRDYYWKNRKKIWPFLEGQTVLVVIAPKKNEFVLIRKRGSDDKYIKLTKLEGIDDERSFEYWINRRVVEFHPVLTGKKTPILWLDIDIHAKTKAKKTALRAKAKKAFPKMRKIMRQFGVAKIYAYDSGIGGYHLEGPLKTSKGVDKLRKDFTAALKAAFADDPSFTTGIAQSGQIRLDTTTMHTLGSLRAPYSFTVAGGTKKRI